MARDHHDEERGRERPRRRLERWVSMSVFKLGQRIPTACSCVRQSTGRSIRHAGLFRAMFHSAVSEGGRSAEALEQVSVFAFEVLVDCIRRCQGAGGVRANMPQELALGAWTIAHGVATLAVDHQLANRGPSSDPVALAREVTQQLYLGLRRERILTHAARGLSADRAGFETHVTELQHTGLASSPFTGDSKGTCRKREKWRKSSERRCSRRTETHSFLNP